MNLERLAVLALGGDTDAGERLVGAARRRSDGGLLVCAIEPFYQDGLAKSGVGRLLFGLDLASWSKEQR